MTTIATDWSGSAAQRREQGVCLPPAKPPNTTPRYRFPAGTHVSVCRVDDAAKQWQPHTTREPLGFHRYESRTKAGLVFRHLGWLIRINVARKGVS